MVISELAASVARQGPLRVDRVDYPDPTVILAGKDWALAITCPWRLLQGQSVVVQWDDAQVVDEIHTLVGYSITEVRSRVADHPNDPALMLTGGYRFEIQADSDLDPWVFHLLGGTFVGSLT